VIEHEAVWPKISYWLTAKDDPAQCGKGCWHGWSVPTLGEKKELENERRKN
jgi:hypothetical protein